MTPHPRFPRLLRLLALAAASGSLLADTLPPDLDAYVAQGMQDWKLPGLAIAVVKDGKPILVKGYGVREAGKPEPVDENTLFAIGSATKAFTATALGMLVDRGAARWDTPVHQIDPEQKFSDPWVTKEVRLSDLTANHSGLSAVSESLWYGTGLSREQILDRLKYVPLSEGFRYHFQYRNVMFLLAGQMIPKLADGQTWDDFMVKEIFTPLGMKRSRPTEADIRKADNVATPHLLNYAREPVVVPYRDMHNIAPAGSIISCASDLVPWLKVHLAQNESAPLLKPETLRYLHTSQTPMWSFDEEGTPRISPFPLQSYCLGWVTQSYRGTRLVWHNGNIDGMSAWVALAPDLGLGVAMLTNLDDCELRTAVFYHILDHALGKEPQDLAAQTLERRDAALTRRDEAESRWQALVKSPLSPALPLPSYTGKYQSPLLGTVTITDQDGTLTYERTPQQTLRLVPTAKDANTFLARHTNANEDLRSGKMDITFTVTDGKVTSMTEGSEGVFLTYQRVE